MATIVEEPRPIKARRHHRPPFSRRLLVSTIRFVVVLLLAMLISGGWYMAKKGFGRKTRQIIVEELRKHGVEARIAHLTIDPFRGLVAQGVRIYDYKQRENTIALVSEISLDINYAALLHHQPFLNALDVRDAELTLPLPGARESKPQLKHFHGHVYFPPEKIYISQAEGVFCGIRISATGELIKRDDYKPSPALSDEEWQRRLGLIQRVVTELQKFKFPGERPTLQIKLSGDLGDMENERGEATLRIAHIQREDYEARDLTIAAEFANQRLNVTRCDWSDASGTFVARGDWNRPTGEAHFQARSTVALKSLLGVFGLAKPFDDAVFTTPPSFDVSGTAQFGGERPQLKIVGQVTIEDFSFHGLALSDLSAQFSWDGERTLVRDIRVRQQTGQLEADLFDAPGDFRLKIDSTINPAVVSSFLSPEMRKFLGEWQWQRAPQVHLEIRGDDRRPQTWHGDGSIAMQAGKFRGVAMNNAASTIHFGDGAVTYEKFRVARDEGVATGTFVYDFKNHEVRISNIKSSLQPTEAVVWVDPTLLKTITPYKFRGAPNLTADGIYQFGSGKNTRVIINVDAPRGMDYVFLGKNLPFDRVAAKLTFTPDHLQIADLKGALFGGSVRGNTELSLAHNDGRYHASIVADHLDFPRLTDLYWNYKTAQGLLKGTYDFTGTGSDARTMKGTGKIEVTNGDVFAIPILGPLSGMLNGLFSGSTGYSVARRATASYKIDNGTIHTDDFEAAGNLFSMLGHGDIHFLDDKLAFQIRMEMHGAAGVLLAPVYKLFEYVGEGSLKKPEWHPKRF